VPISSPEVLVTRLDPDLPLPGHAHPGDAGYRGVIKLIMVNRDPAESVPLRRGEPGSSGYGSTGGHALLLDGTS
jgi:dUTPase